MNLTDATAQNRVPPTVQQRWGPCSRAVVNPAWGRRVDALVERPPPPNDASVQLREPSVSVEAVGRNARLGSVL